MPVFIGSDDKSSVPQEPEFEKSTGEAMCVMNEDHSRYMPQTSIAGEAKAEEVEEPDRQEFAETAQTIEPKSSEQAHEDISAENIQQSENYETKMPTMMYCKYCGKIIEIDSKFCKYCGKKL